MPLMLAAAQDVGHALQLRYIQDLPGCQGIPMPLVDASARIPEDCAPLVIPPSQDAQASPGLCLHEQVVAAGVPALQDSGSQRHGLRGVKACIRQHGRSRP